MIASLSYALTDHYTEFFSNSTEGFSGSYTKNDNAIFHAIFLYTTLLISGIVFSIYFKPAPLNSLNVISANIIHDHLGIIKSPDVYTVTGLLSIAYLVALSLLCFDGIIISLWHYHGYLNKNHYSSINCSLFISTVIYSSLFPLGALLSVSALLIGLANRSILLVTSSSICNLFILAVSFSAASRATSLHLLLIAGIFIIQRTRTFTLLSFLFLFLCLTCYSGALVSRDGNSFGISMIPQFFINGICSLDLGITSIVFDPIIGTLTTAASIQASGNSTYTTEYSLLSFSPLPSFIDGFEQIKNANEKRIHAFIPFSSIAEAWLFGGFYFFLYAAIWGVWVRQLSVMCQIFNYAGLIYSLSIFFVIASSSGQYPLRNTFRFLLATMVVSLAIERYARRRQRQQLIIGN